MRRVLLFSPWAPARDAGRCRAGAWMLACAIGAGAAVPAHGAPFTPGHDAQVLERLPSRATDPQAREREALRRAWREQPLDADRAARLARAWFDAVAAEGDPRYIGYAQAALAPWWSLPDPPRRVRVLRAMLLQFDHRFASALADLDAALAEDPADAEAWAWRLAIQLVQADYASARQSCERLVPLAPPLIGAACRAQVDAATGRGGTAVATLRQALAGPAGGADPAQRLWALTRLAEIEERLGAHAAAEAAFRQALETGVDDVYLLAAYADFLLDRGRTANVRSLLKERSRADVLLLRLAIAAKADGTPDAGALASALGARFDAARLRGDTSHRKEESRYALALRGDAARAVELARANWAAQREPADARILLEAALAARQPTAAVPVLQWLATSGIESVVLRAMAARVEALR